MCALGAAPIVVAVFTSNDGLMLHNDPVQVEAMTAKHLETIRPH